MPAAPMGHSHHTGSMECKEGLQASKVEHSRVTHECEGWPQVFPLAYKCSSAVKQMALTMQFRVCLFKICVFICSKHAVKILAFKLRVWLPPSCHDFLS